MSIPNNPHFREEFNTARGAALEISKMITSRLDQIAQKRGIPKIGKIQVSTIVHPGRDDIAEIILSLEDKQTKTEFLSSAALAQHSKKTGHLSQGYKLAVIGSGIHACNPADSLFPLRYDVSEILDHALYKFGLGEYQV